MTALVDTGFLFALLNEAEGKHEAVSQAFARTPGPWLIPTPAITEVAYLLIKFLGPRPSGSRLASYLESIPASSLLLIEPNDEDYRRAAQLVRQYQESNRVVLQQTKVLPAASYRWPDSSVCAGC